MAKERFDHASIEKKWQEEWREKGIYRSVENKDKPKTYVLDMFPYPSGDGLHVGHPKGYIATDIYSRHKRMQGHSVLHPMGWDAFGLPAENYAIKHKIHPRIAVEQNIANFKQQLAHLGFDYDWSREINTTDPSYYHWTQWIFLKMFEHGLAYQSNEPINWCPSCMTGLANEDLNGALCDRCDTPVEKKELPQWVLKITEYADRMLADLDGLDWPEHIKEAQRNWIGRSAGAKLDFTLLFKKNPADNDWRGEDGKPAHLTVFTTRPDTIYGATYVVIAPDHPWMTLAYEKHADALENADEVRAYAVQAARKTDRERSENKDKTGVEVKGIVAVNPATKEEIPIYVADYVLGSYSTGAVMAVPAHDERDYEFAKKFGLPIKPVIATQVVNPHNPPVPGKPDTKRNVIHGILRNPKDKTVLLGFLKDAAWGDQKPVNFVIGGVEAGEDWQGAALREIREETGYTDLTFASELPLEIRAQFYQAQKGVNRDSHVRTFVFDLTSDAREAVAAEETAKHEFKWVPEKEVAATLNIPTDQLAWQYLLSGGYATTEPGTLVNSGPFTGRDSREAMDDITAAVGGEKTTQYKLRDWVFSRQRYWGEPIPIIHCPKDGAVPVPYEDLPVRLPEVDHYEPTGTGESPLAAITSWVNVACPKCGEPAKRETNTMPQWAGSSWYYLRFMDPDDETQLVSNKNEKYWAPVDVYVGGDHAVRHLIYARFWHKFLYDIAVVSTTEPFKRLEFLGFILAEDGRKMSKRYGNVINPDDVVAEYGADAFRLYEMFMGPFENTMAWSTASIAGTARFVDRIWRAQEIVSAEPVPALETLLQQTIKKVGADIEAFKFNTAISQMMILLNAVEKAGAIGSEQWKTFLRLLAPFAPHITEELWAVAGESGSIHLASWPAFDETAIQPERAEVIVQIAGKKRGSIMLAPEASEADALAEALQLPAVQSALDGKVPGRVIYVPGRILNLVP